MTAPCIMVLGTSSGAGKSYLATALCRWYANAGVDVVPFKAQNMSNNARVVPLPGGGHGEIGAAQYLQALAARAEPQVRMNPVLLKPEADTRSQVILNGRVDAALSARPWRERSALLWPHALQALRELRAAHELVVIEGAGSPAEINLADCDFVNTRTGLAAEAACLLVADIDRGGAFAHLYGTHALMDAGLRAQLRGYVLNKFRGDAALLAPAPEQLQALTGVPTLAVLPFDPDHGLPEEDGLHERGAPSDAAARTVAIVLAPHVSNLDEFEPLRRLPGWRVAWAREAAAVRAADWLILPGSKHTRADLAWLRARGLDAAIRAHVAQGKPLLALCGGLQMLGTSVDDPLGLEGGVPGTSPGMGLLPLHTTLARDKAVRRSHARFAALEGAWAPLSGLCVEGYEIHAGHSEPTDGALHAALPGGLGWQRGNTLALYLHGLFENATVTSTLFGDAAPPVDEAFDRAARQLDRSMAPGALMRLLNR